MMLSLVSSSSEPICSVKKLEMLSGVISIGSWPQMAEVSPSVVLPFLARSAIFLQQTRAWCPLISQ